MTLPAIDRGQMETVLKWGADWLTLGDEVLWATSGGRATLAMARDTIEGTE